jgi:hypothetical protein
MRNTLGVKQIAKYRRLRMRSLVRATAAASVAGYAMVAAAATQVPPDRTILQIGSYVDFGFVVFSPAVPNLEGCSYTAGDLVAIDWSTNANSKSIYATALAAHIAGQKVGFGVSGCHSNGTPLVYRVDVNP